MRTKGAKQKTPTAEARVTIRLSENLLRELDEVADQQLQKRSESIVEAIRLYVRERKKSNL